MKIRKLFESLSRHFIGMPVWRVWLNMIGWSIIITEAVAATMDWLLLGHVTFDYLVTGLLASILVASWISGLLLFTAEQIRLLDEQKSRHSHQAQSLSLIEATLQATDNGILVINHTGKIVLANRRFGEMWRIPPELLSGWDDDKLLALILEQLVDPERFVAKIQEFHQQPEASARDILHFNDGRVFARYSKPQTSGKKVIGRVWSFLDITEQHRSQQCVLQLSMTLRTELKRSERQREELQSLLSAIPDMVWMKDPKGVFLSCNPAFGTLLGAKPAEIIGKTDYDFFPPSVVKKLHAADRAAAESKQPIKFQEWLTYNSDSHRGLLETMKTAVRGKDGKLIGVLGIARDVTKIRLLLEELEKARGEALQSNEAKSRFLANMSHDIRTPMNAVLGFCHLLEQRPLDAETRDLVSKIHSAGHSLLNLINDILDFSKIEAGRLEIEPAPFSLAELLDDLAAIMTASAGGKALELIISPPRESVPLIGDAPRLQQVLVNLLGNAIKFTAQGEVELRVEAEAEDPGGVQLRFTVRDTGIGISKEQQREIFSAFSQADATISRRFGGTGLGLSISQQLVSLMGGTLKVQSTPGLGSEFWFTLPLRRDPKAEAPKVQPDERHLLVADDCANSREALRRTIESLGWKADLVDSGKTALERLEQGGDYDAVLLDWGMPGQDGPGSARAIRSALEAGTGPRADTAPIVAMIPAPARGEPPLDRSAMAKGTATLYKPITAYALRNALAGADGQASAGTGASPDAPAMRIAGIRILVVDDSEINRELARRILEGEGGVVHLAGDGREALDWLEAHPDGVDIVLMDVQMPEMDGYATTRRIREQPRWKDLPVVALTAGAFQNLRDAAKDAGMNDFIAKPFSVKHMMSLIQQWTGHVPPAPGTAAATDDRPAPPIPPRAEAKPEPDPVADTEIDWEAGIEKWGDTQIYLTYLGKFAETYADTGHAIAKLCQAADLVTAATLAHKLKGTAGTLALPRVANLARRLERRLATKDPALDTAAELQAAIDRTRALIAHESAARAQPAPDPAPSPRDDNRGAPPELLAALLTALDNGAPAAAESALGRLRGRVAKADLDAIQARLNDFDFRGAETLAHALIDQPSLSMQE